MLRALYSAAAGMESQQLNLDVISNNLANVNTTGFKKSKIEFEDLLYQTSAPPAARPGPATCCRPACRSATARKWWPPRAFSPNGELSQTGEPLDLAINGDGFFQVTMPDGSMAYTRAGSFKTASDGRIMTSDGLPVSSGFQAVPPGTTNITVASTGDVTYTTPSGTTTYQIQLTRFLNPNGLEALGRNLYKETPSSGSPELGTPGENGFGQLEQGQLEMSNVKVVEEMVHLIMAQRAYEVNSKAVQAADEMLQQGNNLKR